MGKHGQTPQNKQAGLEQKHHSRKNESEGSHKKSKKQAADEVAFTETPFLPPMDKHAAMLSRIQFTAQRDNYILRLHETYGSRYVQRLIESMNARAKLTVSDPNDIYEQEADRVADTVTKTIDSQAQRQVEEEEELQMKSSQIHRQGPEEEELMQGKFDVLRQEEEEELQMTPQTDSAATVAGDVETRINNSRGGGHPLSDDVKNPMEQAFGADFGSIHVHTDSEADVLNKQLNARAFTTGQDIFFREGEYSPGSADGNYLIAHELTHVVQQQGIDNISENPSYMNIQSTKSNKSLETIRRRPGDSARAEDFIDDHPEHGDLVKDISDGMSEFDVVDTLLRNFLYRSDFNYTGQRVPFWSHMGDCFVLCSEFYIICRQYLNIIVDPDQSNIPVFVPGPTKQIGDDRTGNADSGRGWIYDEHFWLKHNGSPFDVLFGHWGIGHFPGVKGVDRDGCEFYLFTSPQRRVYYFNRQAKDLSDVYTSNPNKKARDRGKVPVL